MTNYKKAVMTPYGVEQLDLSQDELLEFELKLQDEVNNKLQNTIRSALAIINSDDNLIYSDVIGNKATEYTAAENAATSFKANDYQGLVPEEIQSWADAKGWDAIKATNDILYQAASWRGAANLIRRNRLKAKEAVRTATTVEQVNAAITVWNTFVVAIRSQLGV